MSDSAKSPAETEIPKVRKLRDAVRKVRIAEAERVDAFADLYEAEKARLGMLADELSGVFREVPENDDYFLFTVAPGNPPRLWIDPTTHVVIARDRRTYRFLKDSRLGRTIIRESADIDDVADAVTDYVAERIVERERALETDWAARPRDLVASASPKRLGVGAVAAFVLGAVLGVAGIVAYAWVTVAPL
jgi:hypothetical protein